MTAGSYQHIIRKLGPGLLFTGAAIGVSHLVQSTRAGAEFGWGLTWAVLAANLFKFPFFEFGPRYALATGESLLEGYRKQGLWVLVLFLLVTLLTVFTVQAAVTMVTAAIAQFMLPIGQSALTWSIIILGVSSIILAIGKYAALDGLIKWVIILLSASTIVALAAAFQVPDATQDFNLPTFNWGNKAHLAFLIALMGWMPAPIDLSVWHSIWSIEKKQLCPDLSLRDCLLDFNIGYIGAAFLALAFLALGTLMMYYQGEAFPPQPAAFANKLISMYSQSLGGWAQYVIAIAALSAMFSTTITCLDAIPRVLARTTGIFLPSAQNKPQLYWLFLLVVIAGALMLISVFTASLVGLVQLATILSFLTAPFFAVANYLLLTGKHTPQFAQPGIPLRILSWAGMAFLVGFCVLYITTL